MKVWQRSFPSEKKSPIKSLRLPVLTGACVLSYLFVLGTSLQAQDEGRDQDNEEEGEVATVGDTSYAPIVIEKEFETIVEEMTEAKPELIEKQRALLEKRYDLSDRPAEGVTMSRGKPVQGGVRVRLPDGVTWEDLASKKPSEIKEEDLWPDGFYPLPHPNHAEGGMLFPQFHIDEIKEKTDRDLTRFDLDFVMPDPFLPEFPPAIFLTTRPDLGDVSQGKLGHDAELLRPLQRPAQSEATGRSSPLGDPVPAATIQRDP